MNEKQLALEIYNELLEFKNEVKNTKKNYIACECFRNFNDSISFQKLSEECKKLGFSCKIASSDKYYKKQIDKNLMQDCYLFTLN